MAMLSFCALTALAMTQSRPAIGLMAPARAVTRSPILQATEGLPPDQEPPTTLKILKRLTDPTESVYRSPPPPPPPPGSPPPPSRPRIPLWRNLAAFAPYSLLAVPSIIGPDKASELRLKLGPVGDALAALGGALRSPIVRSADVVDASGVVYDEKLVGTSGLTLIIGLSFLQFVGNVGPKLIRVGLASEVEAGDPDSEQDEDESPATPQK